ncbi:MAG TPA: hypothetical protein VF297_18230 [Pyrinomonadaceae bacterium]
MYSFLLKKALPFTLTFIFGALLSGLVGLFVSSKTGYEVLRFQHHVGEYGRGRRECRMRRHNLVAETKPLNILYKPQADLSRVSPAVGDVNPVTVNVTFGADGKVRKVEPAAGRVVRQEVWEAAEGAAREIQFEPETVNGLPITVTREVDIQPWRCGNAALTQR